jgi:hypothetical protein
VFPASSQVSGVRLILKGCYRNTPVGEEECSRCSRLGEVYGVRARVDAGAGVCEDGVGAGVGVVSSGARKWR